MDRTIKILNDYPYECLIWKNKISEVKRLTPFLRFCPLISRITRIIAAFCGIRRLCRLKKAAKQLSIRVIREISEQKNNCKAINSLGNLMDIHKNDRDSCDNGGD
jgi:hypothetical protein